MPCQAGELTLFYVVRGQALSLHEKKEGSADSNTQSDLGPAIKDLELLSGFLVLTATEPWFPTVFFLCCNGELMHTLPRSVLSIIKRANKQAYILFKRINKCILSCSVYLIWGYQDSLTHNKDHLRDWICQTEHCCKCSCCQVWNPWYLRTQRRRQMKLIWQGEHELDGLLFGADMTALRMSCRRLLKWAVCAKNCFLLRLLLAMPIRQHSILGDYFSVSDCAGLQS